MTGMTTHDATVRTRSRKDPFVIRTERSGRDLGRVVHVEPASARFGAGAMQPLLDGFLHYDRLTQALMDDFKVGNGRQGMVQVALEDGIESVSDAPATMVALFDELDTVPGWVDWEQLRRGSVAFWRPGPLVSFVFTTAAIVGGDSGYGITRPQMMTGRFEAKAYIRSSETFRWLMAATSPEGMRRFNEGFKLTVRVRMMHSAVRHGLGASEQWDWDNWGTPICASDQMYALAYSFSTVMIDAFEKLGIRYSAQEREDIYALFSYIGYVMGVSQEYLPLSEATCRDFIARWQAIDPGPDDECRKMIHALIDLATPEEPVQGQNLEEVFPALVLRLMPPLRLRAFMYGLIRYLLGDERGDAVAVPNTAWKYAGHVIRPLIRVQEALRNLAHRYFDDEKAAYRTLLTFDKVLGARGDEPVIAPTDEVIEGLKENRLRFVTPTHAH
jgi:hypothetical protein